MKKNILNLIFCVLVMPFFSFAQSPTGANTDNTVVTGNDLKGARNKGFDMPNMSETACGSGQKRKIHDVLADMKPLIINWEGYNCGNCRAHAGKVGKDITKYKDKINFWLAFGALGSDATCNNTGGNSIGKWVADFPGYEFAFGFLDNDKTYCLGDYNLPQFIVIDPRTKKVVINTTQNREGANAFPIALEEALKIVDAITGLDNTESNAYFNTFPNPFNNEIIYKSSFVDGKYLSINDLSGKEISRHELISLESKIDLTYLNNGLYVIKVLDKNLNVLHINKITKE
ncbi:MAG: T9SS C-terminal target domain-containing protein [Cytophagales bacterium]|nr:MAG: T9SS C-terminal target domain-containing protein [Cytophagales bacterium]